MIKPVLALSSSKEYLVDKIGEVLFINIMLEALVVVCDHLRKEHLRVVQRRHCYLREPDHLIQRQLLLLGKLSRPREKQSCLLGNEVECDWIEVVKELIEVKMLFKLLRLCCVK